MASPPTPCTVSAPPTKYDVFLSFGGEEPCYTFASYLWKGLCDARIRTFMEVVKGEEIPSVPWQTIQESKLFLVIFSKNFASSRRCMDELVCILECSRKFGRPVIPIFFDVNTSNVLKQEGSFGEGFDVLCQRFNSNPVQLRKWRNALTKSANNIGWVYSSIRPEFKLVETIVKDTWRKLNCESHPKGIARHIQIIDMLLSEARIVGIWGKDVSGKTTLAKAIFQELKVQFDASSFIENVKGQLKRISLEELEQNCLKELLEDKGIRIFDKKSPLVTNRLGREKILLIFDDVDNPIIVEYLTEVLCWLGKGSRIIITSRAMPVLEKDYAFSTYCLPRWELEDAIQLFSWKAFGQCEPCIGYIELSKSIVKHCQGNPLAFVVLGCFLCGRKKEEWESALEKLDKDAPKDIVDVLKLGYDGLDEKQQNVFLALAFLINERVDISLDLRKRLYDSSADDVISVLEKKSLISFNNHGSIVMQDLVKRMALKIARQQSLKVFKKKFWRLRRVRINI